MSYIQRYANAVKNQVTNGLVAIDLIREAEWEERYEAHKKNIERFNAWLRWFGIEAYQRFPKPYEDFKKWYRDNRSISPDLRFYTQEGRLQELLDVTVHASDVDIMSTIHLSTGDYRIVLEMEQHYKKLNANHHPK